MATQTQSKLEKRKLEIAAELKQIELHEQSIAISNKLFAETDPATRRVLIARDAIRQLKMERINPAGGEGLGTCYLTFGTTMDRKLSEGKLVDLRSETKNIECTACIRGSLLLGMISKFNNLTNHDLGYPDMARGWSLNSDRMKAYEEKFFSANQLALMEAAYEGRPLGRAGTLNTTDLQRSYAFTTGIRSCKERMLKILTNIVTNKGTFVP